jgi:catechol 2,3-dioxygenase-like lactoylglutathione lyase family enzyme
MESVLDTMLGKYEQGKVTRRQFIEAASMLAATAAATPAALAAAPPAPIVPVSVNHIAISVSDLKRSKDWYTRILKLKVIQENEHYALLQFGNTQLVLRSKTEQRPNLVPGTISHVMFGIAPYDEAALFQTLRDQGLTPRKDLESALVQDPDNLLVQIGDMKLGLDKGYPPSSM